jgi:chemotaxis protein methyltransferase CheR
MSTPAASSASDDGLNQLRDLIYEACGIFFPDNKRYFLETRFARRMEAVGAKSYGEYVRFLKQAPDRDTEMKRLIGEITTNETSFFRNMPQFTALQSIIIPKLVEVKGAIGFKRLKIWSAACSSGEEPYTIAMILMEKASSQLAGWQFEVHAADISEQVLAKARDGVYTEYALRTMTDYFKKKYFVQQGPNYTISPEVKKYVRFQNLNLYDDGKMVFMKGFDIIFCCNALIYFDQNSKKKVVQHFFNNLNKGGYLFIGHSESLYGINETFKLHHYPGGVVYQKP